MKHHGADDTTGSDLSERVDSLGWGLLLVAIGAVSLMPAMPAGAWLVAAGMVMLGSSVARRWLQLPARSVTVVIGIVALAAGVFAVAGLTTEIGPLVLIVLGLTLVVGTLYRARTRTNGAQLAHTH